MRVYYHGRSGIGRRCCPGAKVSRSGNRPYSKTHHFTAKQPPWRKFSLIIWIITVSSCAIGQNLIMVGRIIHSRELSETGIHTIIGTTTIKTT